MNRVMVFTLGMALLAGQAKAAWMEKAAAKPMAFFGEGVKQGQVVIPVQPGEIEQGGEPEAVTVASFTPLMALPAAPRAAYSDDFLRTSPGALALAFVRPVTLTGFLALLAGGAGWSVGDYLGRGGWAIGAPLAFLAGLGGVLAGLLLAPFVFGIHVLEALGKLASKDFPDLNLLSIPVSRHLTLSF